MLSREVPVLRVVGGNFVLFLTFANSTVEKYLLCTMFSRIGLFKKSEIFCHLHFPLCLSLLLCMCALSLSPKIRLQTGHSRPSCKIAISGRPPKCGKFIRYTSKSVQFLSCMVTRNEIWSELGQAL